MANYVRHRDKSVQHDAAVMFWWFVFIGAVLVIYWIFGGFESW